MRSPIDVTDFLIAMAAPAISRVSPDIGAVAGGVAITLVGERFTGATSVKIGGTSCTSVVVVDDATITCVTPAKALGTYDVAVVTPKGTGTKLAGFDSWDPVAQGGGLVYFDGGSFTPANWVDKFGNHDAAQANPAFQGVAVPNDPAYGNKPTVNLAGGKYYDTASFSQAQPTTALVVGQAGGTASAFLDAIADFMLIGGVNGTDFGTFAGSAWVAAQAAIMQKHAYVVVENGASTKVYVDSSAAAAATGNPGSNGITGGLRVGKRHDTADAWNGKAACVILWVGAFDAATVGKSLRWAASQFGATWR